MQPDRFKKRHQAPRAHDRLRGQIAVEAAKRLLGTIAPRPEDASGRLREASEAEYYAAKRKAAAVLGHRVRPGDLPSDSEIREQVLGLIRSDAPILADDSVEPEPAPGTTVARLADHVDRFAIYKLRLAPLEAVKQNPKSHPEGDALYHSLQVFERAREARPYDEEFLLAALLHDVGKGIDPRDHAAAAVEALRGAVPDRTLTLIQHHKTTQESRDRPSLRPDLGDADLLEDLALLRDLDEAGRVPGVPVGTVDEALDYLRELDREGYLSE
jgi:hypothetical protein